MFQVPDWELLHAIVGLYDSYLPEITPEVLYNTLTCRSSLTLVFLKEPEGISKVKTVLKCRIDYYRTFTDYSIIPS